MKNKIDLDCKYKSKVLFDDFIETNNILTYYYLPLIKSEAYSLYFYLYLESKNSSINSIFIPIDRIIEMINLSIEKINEALNKLEVLNLIEIYKNNNNQIIFELKKPLLANEFINSEQFYNLLKSSITKNNCEINNAFFNSLRKNHYDDFKSITEEINLNVGKNKHFKKSSLNISYDFSTIKLIISSKNIDWNLFWSNDLEQKILDLTVLKKVNDFEIAMEIIDQFEKYSKLNLEKLFKKFNNKNKNINDIYLNNNENSNKDKIEILSKMDINDFFISKLKRQPIDSEKDLIKKLKVNYELSDFSINLLIDFSLIVNDGLINAKYILKIVNTLIKENKKSPEQIINHLKKAYNLKKNKKTKSSLSKNKLMEDMPVFD